MTRRLGAIIFIYGCTALAWMVLAGTITSRTYSSDDASRKKVAASWGAPQVQKPPVAWLQQAEPDPANPPRLSTSTVNAPVDGSRIDVDLALDQRQKGLLWYRTYAVTFTGDYAFRNPTDQPQTITFSLPLPSEQAIYDDLQAQVDGSPAPVSDSDGAIRAAALVPAHQLVHVRFGYRSHGLDSWKYDFGDGVAHVRDFN
ncbi:MAG: hypothetical protein ACRD3E_00700, partial [Terriglobales bacterium]